MSLKITSPVWLLHGYDDGLAIVNKNLFLGLRARLAQIIFLVIVVLQGYLLE